MTHYLNTPILRRLLLPLLLTAPLPLWAQVADQKIQDPITFEATELLDESGLLARQSRLGEGILILDRQLRHAEAIERLIQVLGPDALIEVSPGEFMRFADTPAGMRARIKMVRLQKELDQMSAQPVAAAQAQPARSDGSELIDQIDQRLTEIEGERSDSKQEIEADTEGEPRQISVREIFGTGSDLSAILQYGPDRVRIRTGDSLLGGVQIVSVERDSVLIVRRGQELRLQLPN